MVCCLVYLKRFLMQRLYNTKRNHDYDRWVCKWQKEWCACVRVFLRARGEVRFAVAARFQYSYTEWHKKKRELLKNPTKMEEIQEKKITDRNWTITTRLLRDSNPNYQCLKITSCRWRPPPRMHSFTATTHFKSSRSFVSPCVCCMLCRMRLCRILQSMHHTQGDT